MDCKKTVFIKEEVTDQLYAEPYSMYLEDPLKTEKPCLRIKQEQEPELKWHVDGSEHNVQVYSSTVNVKEELEEGVNQEVLEDPLGILSTDFIKRDPELNLEADETQNTVVASTRYVSNSTRIIKSIEYNHGISSETPLNQRGVHEELEESTEESTTVSMCGTHTPGFTSEDSVFGTKLKCCLREKEFHKFSCSVCLQSFPSKYRLLMHVFIHIDDVEPPTYVCESCGEVFSSDVSLHTHLKMSDGDQAVSPGINEIFDSSDKHKHFFLQGDRGISFSEEIKEQSSSKETKMSKKSSNDICNTHTRTGNAEKWDRQCNFRTLSTTGNINAHAVQLTAKRPCNCDACGKSFTQFCDLDQHSLIHTRPRPHKCNTCGKSFIEKDLLKKHELIHYGTGPYKCNICGKYFSVKGALKQHEFTHTGTKPHPCDICGKSFTLPCHLKSHALTHTGQRPHTCDTCGKTFILLTTLRTHTLIHTGKRPHKCNVCGKSFTQAGDLKRHVRIHTGERPHKCNMCGKSFNRSDKLKDHELRHTGKRPHKCNVCDKTFTFPHSLKDHTLIHTGKTSRPYKCDICGKAFTGLSLLKCHVLIHSGKRPHKCNVCGKSFTQASNLKSHALIHTGKRPHKCNTCGKSFIRSGNLKIHELRHTGERPHKCHICGKSFTQSCELKRHGRIRIGE